MDRDDSPTRVIDIQRSLLLSKPSRCFLPGMMEATVVSPEHLGRKSFAASTRYSLHSLECKDTRPLWLEDAAAAHLQVAVGCGWQTGQAFRQAACQQQLPPAALYPVISHLTAH